MFDPTTRPVHAAHRAGALRLAREALALPPTDESLALAGRVLARLVGEGATYAELNAVDRRSVERAVDRVLPDSDVPESRVGELHRALALLTPGRRACDACGRLDLARTAGQWIAITDDRCPCAGVFGLVAFDTPRVAWTDGAEYPPDAAVDREHFPITDDAIGAWLQERGSAVDPWIIAALARTQGALTLSDLCGALLRGGDHANPSGSAAKMAVLRSLSEARTTWPSEASLRVAVDRALALRGAAIVVAEVDGAAEQKILTAGAPLKIGRLAGPQVGALCRALVSAFPTRAAWEQLVYFGIETQLSAIAGEGGLNTVSFNVVTWAEARGVLTKLVDAAQRQNPGNPELRAFVAQVSAGAATPSKG